MAEKPPSPPQVPPRGKRMGRSSSGLDNFPTYYHPCVENLDQVKQLMVQYVGQEGAFVIRNSFSKPGSYTASVMHGEGIKHFNILRNGVYFNVQDERFNSINDVVEYFSHHEVPNQEGVKHVMLRYPIPCNQCRKDTSTLSTVSTPSSTRSQTMFRSTSDISSSNIDLGHSASSSVTLPPNLRIVPHEDMVPLPAPASSKTPSPGKKSRFSNFFGRKHNGVHKTDKSKRLVKSETDAATMVEIARRPPCPLPDLPPSNISGLDYEVVRNTDESRLDELIRTLQLNSDNGMEKCECGLTIDESELPNGWSMHISHDENTQGRLFFMGPRGETSWNMPLEVSLSLCADDQDRIKEVKAKCDDLQQQYRMDVRSRAQSGAQGENTLSTGSFSNPSTSGFQNNSGGQQNHAYLAEGAASGDSLPSNIRGAMQHNEYTGSTTGMSPGISTASMAISAGY